MGYSTGKIIAALSLAILGVLAVQSSAVASMANAPGFFTLTGSVFYDANGNGHRDVGEDLFISSGDFGCPNALIAPGVSVQVAYSTSIKQYPISTCGSQLPNTTGATGVYYQTDPILNGAVVTVTLIYPAGWAVTQLNPATFTFDGIQKSYADFSLTHADQLQRLIQFLTPSPADGPFWPLGGSRKIEWLTLGFPTQPTTTVTLLGEQKVQKLTICSTQCVLTPNGGYFNWTIPFPIPEGRYFIHIEANSSSGPPLSAATDSVFPITLIQQGSTRFLPDLVITSVHFEPPVPLAGEPVEASVTVKNQGAPVPFAQVNYGHTASLAGRAVNIFPYGMEGLQWSTGKEIVTSGELHSYQTSATSLFTQPGDYPITFSIALETSGGSVLTESNMDNNSLEVALRVRGDFNSGDLVRTPDRKIFAIFDAQKLWIPTPQAFKALGYQWENVKDVTDSQLVGYDLAKLIKSESSPKIYYLAESGMKRYLPNADVFLSYGNDWSDVVTVPQKFLAMYPDVTLIRKMGQTEVYRLEKGKKRLIANASVFRRLKLDWRKVSAVNAVELAAYPAGPAIR